MLRAGILVGHPGSRIEAYGGSRGARVKAHVPGVSGAGRWVGWALSSLSLLQSLSCFLSLLVLCGISFVCLW